MARECSLIIRLRADELAAFQRAAKPTGLVVSSWARFNLLKIARTAEETPPDREDSAELKRA